MLFYTTPYISLLFTFATPVPSLLRDCCLASANIPAIAWTGTNVVGAHSVEEMCAKLKKPRRVMLLVKAGPVVDKFIEQVLPFMEKGDIIIDGGNSVYTDSNRRCRDLASKGILFIGTGVSGGEEGARFGPSLMPGGNPAAW